MIQYLVFIYIVQVILTFLLTRHYNNYFFTGINILSILINLLIILFLYMLVIRYIEKIDKEKENINLQLNNTEQKKEQMYF